MQSRSSEQLVKTAEGISAELIDAVCARLARNRGVRRTLPHQGRLHIDRQLPFLTVYRRPADRIDAGTSQLVKAEAAYLIAPSDPESEAGVSTLVREVVRTLSQAFGAFLIVEIWSAPHPDQSSETMLASPIPQFTVHASRSRPLIKCEETLGKRLVQISVQKQSVAVELVRDDLPHPQALPALLSAEELKSFNCAVIGLEVPPVYRSPEDDREYPLVLRSFRRSLGLALRQTYFEFAREHTTHDPAHYHALGRKAVVQAVWRTDQQLAEVSNQFDYLVQLTPINTTAAWIEFQKGRFDRQPEFYYRPLPIDPAVLKRELYSIPVERVEDPALQRLFQEKQDELELKLSMLRDRDTPRFLYESLQLFGGVHDELLFVARSLLSRLPAFESEELEDRMGAAEFAARAEAEIDYYKQRYPAFRARTKIASDVSGLIVSRGKLLIGADLSLPRTRVEALMAHEVGTHLVTYYNGRAQPFQQLHAGLAGYEELQEGLAVLAEYLVGGLNRGRIRQLAARVLAVHALIEGAGFVDTYRHLTEEYAISPRTAFLIVMRVFRGGGFTKDAVYLRGLNTILKYVQKGGDLKPLLVGKMAVEHIPIIKELQYRNVLVPPPLTPRYLESPQAEERLAALRHDRRTLVELVGEHPD